MRLATLVITLIFSLSILGCSKKSNSHSTVKIQFDQSLYSGSVSDLEKVSSATAADGTPTWGLADPTSLSQINCWGVFVGGPEDFLKGSQCTNSNDQVIAQFGPRAGFYPINESGEVFVPAGENRVFFLAGMASSTGDCEEGFGANPNINFSNYSAPFILGQAEANLVNAEETIPIQLVDSFSGTNRIKECDFLQPGQGNSPTPLTLNVTYPETKRTTFVADNTLARTVNFSYTGDNVQCSEDGGTTFSSCTSSNQLV